MDDIRRKLAAARGGDRTALGELLSKSRKKLRQMAHVRRRRLLAGCAQTSDLLQATYLDVLSSMPSFRGSTEHAFEIWMARILENNIRDARKYHVASKRDRQLEHSMTREEENTLADLSPSPPSELALNDDSRRIASALRSLPGHYRAALLERLDQTESKPRSGRERMLLVRARAALALELEKVGGPRSV